MSNNNYQDDAYDYANVGGDDFAFTIADDSSNTGQITIPSSGTITTSGGGTSYVLGSGYGTIGVNGTFAFVNTNSTPVKKTDVKYIIVLCDNSCLEFEEQNPVSPREIIGIMKFITMVNSHLKEGTSVGWKKLTENLLIERHFVSGKIHYNEYDQSGQTQFMFLMDK